MNNQAQNLEQNIQNKDLSQEKQMISGWVSYIALGTFRIDDGQSIEYLYPPNSVTPEERKSIAMISFPDTQSLNQGNDLMLEYCFRMKIRETYQLGFVFFFRKKDPSIDRGYIQKSIILITRLPLIHFYQHILNHLGEIFYEQKLPYENIMKKAIEDIESWPEPENSKLYKLQFLSQNYTVSIPSYLLKNKTSIGYAQLATNSSPIRERENAENSDNKSSVLSAYATNSINGNKNGTINDSNKKEGDNNTQLSSDESKIKHQIPKSISHNDFRIKNNLKIHETGHLNHQVINMREDSKQFVANFFSTKNANQKALILEDQQEEQFQQGQESELDKDLPNLEIRGKQRSNSLETQQEFSLSRQIKQKNNLSEILKLNDAQEEGLFQEINVFRHVQLNKLHALWPIWEMVLVNQPFLLTANTPSECSAAILGFISLISPLQFSGDYRPYFTVYDTEYKKINIEYEQNMLRNYILGTCNPLFQMTMKNFPVIIGFDSKSEQQQLQEAKKNKKPIQSIKYNKVKSEIIPDNKQLEKLLLNSNTPEVMAINNTLVRKHFRVLTSQFLEPINKFLEEQTTVNNQHNEVINIYNFFQKKQVKVFEEKAFLSYLKKRKSSIQHLYKEKSQLYLLYERFLRSLNFLRFIRNKPNTQYQHPFAPLQKR